MSVNTLSKEATEAVKYFEAKLTFEFGPIGLSHAIKNGEKLQIVDLRTPELYEQGHVPGAINLSFETLEKSLEKLNAETTTVVYCYDGVCHLSAKAALLLAQKGYKVRELIGGWAEWASHELKVEGKASSCSSHKSSCG